MAQTTLYTLAQRNESDAFTGLIEDVTTYSPEFYEIPAVARAGTTYRTLSRTALPTAQWRQANQALTGSSSQYAQRVHEMFFLDVPIIIDEMVYKGDDGVTGDLLYQEAQGGLQSAINLISSQTYYGQAGDGSNGFVGLRAQLLPTGSGITAVTASAANNTTTAYGLWLNPQGVSYQVGKYGEIAFPSFKEQLITTGNLNNGINAAGYRAWYTNISSFIGLGVGSINSVFGITGVSQAAGAGLTDILASKLLVTVPLTRRAGFTWFMNRLAYQTLQASRTAINYQPAGPKSGTPAWSPPPLEMEGHRIVQTDAILNTENNT